MIRDVNQLRLLLGQQIYSIGFAIWIIGTLVMCGIYSAYRGEGFWGGFFLVPETFLELPFAGSPAGGATMLALLLVAGLVFSAVPIAIFVFFALKFARFETEAGQALEPDKGKN